VLAHSSLCSNDLAWGAFRIGYKNTRTRHSGPLS
jgi:hypothetical protein